MNAAFCVFVVFAHAAGEGVARYDPSSPGFALCFLAQIPVGYAVHGFVFLSGLKLCEFFAFQVVTGDIEGPFYYIIIALQFYLLLPATVRLLNGVKPSVLLIAAAVINLFFFEYFRFLPFSVYLLLDAGLRGGAGAYRRDRRGGRESHMVCGNGQTSGQKISEGGAK